MEGGCQGTIWFLPEEPVRPFGRTECVRTGLRTAGHSWGIRLSRSLEGPRTSLELFLQCPQRSLQTTSLSRREVSLAFQTRVRVRIGNRALKLSGRSTTGAPRTQSSHVPLHNEMQGKGTVPWGPRQWPSEQSFPIPSQTPGSSGRGDGFPCPWQADIVKQTRNWPTSLLPPLMGLRFCHSRLTPWYLPAAGVLETQP